MKKKHKKHIIEDSGTFKILKILIHRNKVIVEYECNDISVEYLYIHLRCIFK